MFPQLGYKKCFPEMIITLPDWVVMPYWEDMSDHIDRCPAFVSQPDRQFVLWVDDDRATHRLQPKQYKLVKQDELGHEEWSYECDDADLVKHVLDKLQK